MSYMRPWGTGKPKPSLTELTAQPREVKVSPKVHALNAIVSEGLGFDVSELHDLRIQGDKGSLANVMLAVRSGMDTATNTPFIEIAAIPVSACKDAVQEPFTVATGGRGVTITVMPAGNSQIFDIRMQVHSVYDSPYKTARGVVNAEDLQVRLEEMLKDAVAGCRHHYKLSMFGAANLADVLYELRQQDPDAMPESAAPAMAT